MLDAGVLNDQSILHVDTNLDPSSFNNDDNAILNQLF